MDWFVLLGQWLVLIIDEVIGIYVCGIFYCCDQFGGVFFDVQWCVVVVYFGMYLVGMQE